MAERTFTATREDAPAACCPFSRGLYVWQLSKTRRTEPVPYQGTRGLFAVEMVSEMIQEG